MNVSFNFIKTLIPEDRFIIFLNALGVSGNLVAWFDDNKVFASNLLLFGIPTFLYTYYRFRQKYKHQEKLNTLEIERLKKEAGIDEDESKV